MVVCHILYTLGLHVHHHFAIHIFPTHTHQTIYLFSLFPFGFGLIVFKFDCHPLCLGCLFYTTLLGFSLGVNYTTSSTTIIHFIITVTDSGHHDKMNHISFREQLVVAPWWVSWVTLGNCRLTRTDQRSQQQGTQGGTGTGRRWEFIWTGNVCVPRDDALSYI